MQQPVETVEKYHMARYDFKAAVKLDKELSVTVGKFMAKNARRPIPPRP